MSQKRAGQTSENEFTDGDVLLAATEMFRIPNAKKRTSTTRRLIRMLGLPDGGDPLVMAIIVNQEGEDPKERVSSIVDAHTFVPRALVSTLRKLVNALIATKREENLQSM